MIGDGPLRRTLGRAWPLILVVALLAGCVAYRPKPIDAPEVEAGFRARTLSDPGLRAYVEANRPAEAGPFPPPTWDLATLTLVAFYYQPALDLARARVGLAEAGIVTAGARPNPSVDLSPTYATNPGAGVSPWTLGFTFDIPIETAGKRGYRIAQAERLTDQARLELGEAAWTVRSRLRAALVDYLLTGRELDLLRAEEQARQDSVAVMERRLAVGGVSRPDVDVARIALASTRLAVHAAEGRVAETRVALADALGLPVMALADAGLDWPDLDTPPDEATVSPQAVQRAGLLNRLDVRGTLASYAATEAALRLEVAKQYPDVHVGPGYTWDQGVNKYTIGLSITLPILNRNEGPIAEAEAHRRAAAGRFLALEAQVIAGTEKARARYRAALAELTAADAALALVRQQEAAVRRALEAGQEDRLTLSGVRVQVAVAARDRLNALRRTQAGLGALEDAVQRPLGGAAALPSPPSHPREGTQENGKS